MGPVQVQSSADGGDDDNPMTFDPTGVADFSRRSGERIASAGSVLAAADAYNFQRRYLSRAAGLTLPLGDRHRDALDAAFAAFGDQRGRPRDRRTLARSLHEATIGKPMPGSFPAALVHWSLTAGGLGVISAPLIAAAHRLVHEEHRRTKPPALTDPWLKTA